MNALDTMLGGLIAGLVGFGSIWLTHYFERRRQMKDARLEKFGQMYRLLDDMRVRILDATQAVAEAQAIQANTVVVDLSVLAPQLRDVANRMRSDLQEFLFLGSQVMQGRTWGEESPAVPAYALLKAFDALSTSARLRSTIQRAIADTVHFPSSFPEDDVIQEFLKEPSDLSAEALLEAIEKPAELYHSRSSRFQDILLEQIKRNK